LLSFCTHDSQETLLEVRVSEKTNEIPVAKAVLPTLPLSGRVCTANALHTHADFMHPLHGQQADTVLTVKGNQPTLFADRATYFADP
jgi:hypothetical protein